MIRLAMWLLRHKRLRFDATCPHGTFVPAHRRIGAPASRYGCERCDFHVRLAFVDDPYRSES